MSSLKATSANSAVDDRSSGTFRRPANPQSSSDDAAVYCFSIRADLDPGLLSRLLGHIAKRGLWPTKFYSQVITPDLPQQSAEATIDMQLVGLDNATCDHIAMQFRGMVGVQSVLTSFRTSSD